MAAEKAVVTAVLLRNASFRAVLGAKRPVESRLGRQETRLEAVLGARRAVRRLSWTPGGPSAGRLGRQEARMQVLLQFCCKMQVLRSWQQGSAYKTAKRSSDNLCIEMYE